MAEPIADDCFIVISGHQPQTGKRERISRVRAHITRRYFRRLQQKAEAEPRLALTSGHPRNRRRRDVDHPPLGTELRNLVPATNHALLDPAFFTAETSRRMHKFFDLHLRGHVDSHPVHRNVVRWAISDPYFTSAKLLNASGWDDILESGELSLWTTRQRFITVKLLNDTLTNEAGAKNKHITVSAIQSLLAFELLIGNNENIDRLYNFCQSLITQSTQPNIDIWTFITRTQYLLSYADRLRRTGDDDNQHDHILGNPYPLEQDTDPYTCPDYQFVFPVDFSMFTLNQPSLAEDQHLVYVLLCDLHHILSIANSCQTAPLSRSTYEHVISQHKNLLPYIPDQDPTNIDHPIPAHDPTSCDTSDRRIAPLRLSIFILTSCLLSSRNEEAEEDRTQNLADLASGLRALLGSAVTGLRDHTNWMPFPGALVWCYAIGLRFADPRRDRTWFLMQFLRVTHLYALETWEETSRSLEALVCGLERIGRLNVEQNL